MSKIKSMTIYSICHFLVDFVSCLFVLGVCPALCIDKSGAFSDSLYFMEVIIYNFFAFAFQVPLGAIMDKFRIYKYVGIVGFCLVGLAFLINAGNPILLSSIVGIGNALFHLEGGVNAYEHSKGTAFLNGVFVAPGAFGIFLGTFFYNQIATTFLPIILIALAIIMLLFVQKDELPYVKEEQERVRTKGNPFGFREVLLILLLIGISIIVRSIGGGAIKYAWKLKDVLWIGLSYTGFVFLGKALGGYIADRVGLKKTALIALAMACVSLIIGFTIPFFGFLRNVSIQCSNVYNITIIRKLQ